MLFRDQMVYLALERVILLHLPLYYLSIDQVNQTGHMTYFLRYCHTNRIVYAIITYNLNRGNR